MIPPSTSTPQISIQSTMTTLQGNKKLRNFEEKHRNSQRSSMKLIYDQSYESKHITLIENYINHAYTLNIKLLYYLIVCIRSVSNMDKDYYSILEVKRDASPQQISNNYKRLVLRWHPKFAKENQNTAQYHFSEISEAYEVLNDPLKRSFFDKYGWKKLKDGLFQEGQLKGGYRFANNPDQIFQQFLLANNIFAQPLKQKLVERGSILSHAFGALNYVDENKRQDLVVNVPCKLQQLYSGVAKRIQFQRRVLNNDGRTLSMKEQQKLIQIKPGFDSQTQLVFNGCGHECIDRKKTDLIFKIQQIPHPAYERKGNDLIYKIKLGLDCALACEPLEIFTLDNRKLIVGIDEIPNPQSTREIPNQGMPRVGQRTKGNLLIKFDIVFPQKLTQKTRKQIRGLLS